MAQQMYVTIKGVKQGLFKGQGRDGKITLVSFEYEVVSQHDPASGQATGRRQHHPIVIRKEVDAASPMLFQALVTNEVLSSVNFEFLTSSQEGREVVDYTILLTNAMVALFRESVRTGEQGGPPVDSRRLDEVSFTFQKIEIVNLSGKTQASDDWLDSA